VLEEVLSNCRKYRAPDTPIVVTTASIDGMLRLDISNQNQADGHCLTEDECILVFEPGYRLGNATGTSTGIGLDTVVKAVAAAHGTVRLRTHRDEASPAVCHTICHVELPADDLSHGDLPGAIEEAQPAPPLALEPRVLESPSLRPQLGGATVSRGPTAVAQEPASIVDTQAEPASAELPARVVAVGIDDDAFTRQIHALLFQQFLGLPTEDFRALGADSEEIDAFLECAVGARSLHDLRPVRAEDLRRPADIVVIDQNIERPQGSPLQGTDLAAALRQRGFEGVICLLTASSSHKLDEISRLRDINLAFAKGEHCSVIAQGLRDCLEAKQQQSKMTAGAVRMESEVQVVEAATNSSAETVVLNLSHFEGTPGDLIQTMIGPFFDPVRPSSAAVQIDCYERALAHGEMVSTHRLVGGARMAGCVELSRLAEQFETAPSASGIHGLRCALKQALAELQRRGLWPSPLGEGQAEGQNPPTLPAGSSRTATSSEDAITGASATRVMAVDKGVFDPADILRDAGGNVAVMRRLLTMFNGETHMNSIEAALDASDAAQLHYEIHKLRGLLLYLRANAVHERVWEFEAAASASIGKDWTSIQQERLRAMADQLRIDVARIDANRLAVLGSDQGHERRAP